MRSSGVENTEKKILVEPLEMVSNADTSKDAKPEALKSYKFKSDDPKYLLFTEEFEDWSEEQKRDAYDNNFKLYLQKSVRPWTIK